MLFSKKINKNLRNIIFSLMIGSFAISSCDRVKTLPNDPSNGSRNVTQSSDPNGNDNALPVPPEKFLWGVSTAGYQAEGNDRTSIWHFWDLSGKTKHRNLKGVDFYNRYEEDIGLARNDLKANAFRLSIEWSRIEPRKGEIDRSEIEYYRRILTSIKNKGMEPVVTLHHFNFPQWMLSKNEGRLKGMENKKFIEYFSRYTELVVKEFGPLVKYWVTFNEPNIYIPGGYLSGTFPPGMKNPIATTRVALNTIKAHAESYDIIHKLDPDAMVSSNLFYIQVKLGKKLSSAENANNTAAILETDWFMDGLSGEEFSSQGDSGVGLVKKMDYVAFDYYYIFKSVKDVLNLQKPWLMPLYPQGLYDAIMYYHKKYKLPIVVAENGMATEDLKPRPDGWTRSSAIVHHVDAMKRAMADGANVIGYFHWSITDNYEWGHFTPRFGLYSIEALTDPKLIRTPTPAVDVYREVIKNNGVTPKLISENPKP